MAMIDRFPYCPYHNPSYCDHCADDGFVETPHWRASWDLAAAVFDDTGDEAAAALAFRGLAPDGRKLTADRPPS